MKALDELPEFELVTPESAVRYATGCAIEPSDRAYCFSNTGSKVIKLFSCSTQLSMKISLSINMKMPTIVGIFIFISREIFVLSYISKKEFEIVSNLKFSCRIWTVCHSVCEFVSTTWIK